MKSICTANIDFAKSRRQHRRYIAHLLLLCEVLFVQEAKFILLRNYLPRTWNTMQRIRSVAVRGSAIAWRRPMPHGGSRLFVGVRPVARVNGRLRVARMNTRWIALLVSEIDGKPTALISAHWPPIRYAWLWPRMDAAVAQVIVRQVLAGREVVLGADFNAPVKAVARRLNSLLAPHGISLAYREEGIVGFVFTTGIKIATTEVNFYGKSQGLTDHPALIIYVFA